MNEVMELMVLVWMSLFFIVAMSAFFIDRFCVSIKTESRFKDHMPMWYSKKITRQYRTKNKGVF